MPTFLLRSAIVSASLAAMACMQPGEAGTLVVTTTAQKIGTDGGCSLQEAIYAANRNAASAISGYKLDPIDRTFKAVVTSTRCRPGNGHDTLLLPPNARFALQNVVDDEDNQAGPTATPIITSEITLEANGATFVWTGSKHARLFTIGKGGRLTIRNAYITGFSVQGGNGARGGGGGLAAGGAIYVLPGGVLDVEQSTFDANIAYGGNGAAALYNTAGGYAGGGGGGLSGSGAGSQSNGSVDEDRADGGGGGGGARGAGVIGNRKDSETQGDDAGGGGGGGTLYGAYRYRQGWKGGGKGGGVFSSCIDTDSDGGQGDAGGGGGGGQGSVGVCRGSGDGGPGGYGAGGGGGGGTAGNGGTGGFGGGGGSSGPDSNLYGPLGPGNGPVGGNGGFGGGGGASHGGLISRGGPGRAGMFAGKADKDHGGGGGALGGAIFNDSGSVTIRNSTFANNFVFRGNGGGGTAGNGADAGGAIFSRNGILEVIDSTISDNASTGSGAGIVVVGDGDTASFTLNNSLLYGNGASECFMRGSVATIGVGNLIGSNGDGSANFQSCPGLVSSADPLLGPLQQNFPGMTPTMSIPGNSPAFNTADPGASTAFDQRGEPRPSMGGADIGAFELCTQRFGPFIQVCALPPVIAQTAALTVSVTPLNGGDTTPSAGDSNYLLNSVALISAKPRKGYSFKNWSGAAHLNASSWSAANSVTMDSPTDITAVFAQGSTTLSGELLTRSGPQNARLWKVTLTLNGVVNAHEPQVANATLAQTAGTKCSPVLVSSLPVLAPVGGGYLVPGQSAVANVVFDFTGCSSNARFAATLRLSANGGGIGGKVSLANQAR